MRRYTYRDALPPWLPSSTSSSSLRQQQQRRRRYTLLRFRKSFYIIIALLLLLLLLFQSSFFRCCCISCVGFQRCAHVYLDLFLALAKNWLIFSHQTKKQQLSTDTKPLSWRMQQHKYPRHQCHFNFIVG